MDNTKYKFRFSVFTATRNRAQMLWRLYLELKVQIFKDFEWVIINDGSSDNTDDVVKKIKEEKALSIQYLYKAGGGKHTAWRVATPLFQGQYVVTADDDDNVTKDMLAIFDKHWANLEQSVNYNLFWEIRSRCKRIDGSLIGQILPSPWYDSDYNIVSYKLKVFCEMVGCRKVEVLRNEAAVPAEFPFMDDASNFDEAIRWSRAARKYKTRFVPEVTRIYNETPNSLCANTFDRCIAGEKRIIANKMVEFYYTLLERSDLLLRYDKKRYVKTLFGYSFLIALYNHTGEFSGLSLGQKWIIHVLTPLCRMFIKYRRKKK